MVDLVQCSFAIALTPMALGLAWRLISGIGNSSGRGRTPTGEAARGPTTIDGNPVDVLATNFGRPASLFGKFPRDRVFIAPTHGAPEIE